MLDRATANYPALGVVRVQLAARACARLVGQINAPPGVPLPAGVGRPFAAPASCRSTGTVVQFPLVDGGIIVATPLLGRDAWMVWAEIGDGAPDRRPAAVPAVALLREVARLAVGDAL